jgi:GH24 family phage-related lysozyme (muramidase)
MKVTNEAINLIKYYEGFRAYTYLCPAGIKTIGYGTTNPRYAKDGAIVTPTEAERILTADLVVYEIAVSQLLRGHIVKQARFDALVCFAYNVGIAALKNSTLLKRYLEGDVNGAAQEFYRWNKANGKELQGLTRRRKAEAHLFITGEFKI